jgi:hypothetical protein
MLIKNLRNCKCGRRVSGHSRAGEICLVARAPPFAAI